MLITFSCEDSFADLCANNQSEACQCLATPIRISRWDFRLQLSNSLHAIHKLTTMSHFKSGCVTSQKQFVSPQTVNGSDKRNKFTTGNDLRALSRLRSSRTKDGFGLLPRRKCVEKLTSKAREKTAGDFRLRFFYLVA